jgi:hypothetical protein
MSDSNKTVAYNITADNSVFVQAVTQSATAVTGLTDQVKKGFGGVGEVFEKIQKPLLAMTAIIGGGSFFKEAIGVTNKLNGEAMRLSKALGITGDEAATLRTALGDIYSDTDTYVGAFQKFAKQVKSNEEGLQNMGIATRDSNGNLRDSNTLFTEALNVVGSYKPGLDQTTAAMTLFGKGVDEVMTLQKLNNGVLAEAKEKNEQLGMTLTKEGVTATKQYKAAMNDVGDVLEAVKNAVGQAVMPIFTELGQYFAQSGPYMVNVFKGALTGLVVVFRVVQGAVQTMANVIFEVISTVVDGAGLMGDVFSKLFKGDFGGAVESAKALGSRVGQGFTNGVAAFVDVGNEVEAKVKSDMARIWGKGTAVDAPKGGTKAMGDFSKTNGGGAEKTQMPDFERTLADQKAALAKQGLAEGQFREMSKADEAKYWNDIKNLASLSRADRAAAGKKASEAELAAAREALEGKLATLKAEDAAIKYNFAEKIRIEQQVQAMYANGSKGYEEAQARINALQIQAAEQAKAVNAVVLQAKRDASLAAISLEEQQAQFEQQLGVTSQGQLLEQQKQFEDRRYQIAADAMRDRLALAESDPDRNPAEVASLHAQLEALEQQHVLKMKTIEDAAKLDGMQPVINVFKTAENSIAQSLQNMINGTQTMKQAMTSIWKSLAQSVISEMSKMIAKRLAMWAVEKALALAGITTNAAQAGSGAASSVASIPYVGPVLAIAAMASVFGAVSGMQSNVPSASASAAGGFDIPHSVNPLVQTHAREMILPAKYADLIRGMADGEGAGGGGDVHHWSISAVDSRGFEDMLFKRGGADVLVKALKERRRNGAF